MLRALRAAGNLARRLLTATGLAKPKPVLSNGDNQPPRHDGPPDLEQIWQDLQRRVAGLFGRRPVRPGGPPSPGPRGPGLPRLGAVLAAAAVAAILVWLGSGLFIVQEGQAGVVLEFGRYKYTTGAGIQWRWPYPIETTEIVNLSQARSIEIGRNNVIRATNQKDSSMLTRDENIVDVRFAVQYRVQDPTDYLFNNADTEETVEQAAETAVREIVGNSDLDFVLYEGREKVSIDLQQSIQRILDLYKTGILVTSVTLQNVQPPEQVQAAFDDAVKAGQDRERHKSEGQAYANDVVPRAGGDAARMLEEAQGYRSRVIATAQGDAQRFLQIATEYAKAPAVTRERMYLQALQDIYANSAKVVIDAKQGGNVLYLPLDKLLGKLPPGAAAAVAVPPPGAVPSTVPATPAFPSTDDDRSRDASRGRDVR